MSKMEEYYVLLASLIFIEPRAGLFPGSSPAEEGPFPGPRGQSSPSATMPPDSSRARVATSVTFAATKAPTLRKPA
jgi:hypothetical protein